MNNRDNDKYSLDSYYNTHFLFTHITKSYVNFIKSVGKVEQKQPSISKYYTIEYTQVHSETHIRCKLPKLAY